MSRLRKRRASSLTSGRDLRLATLREATTSALATWREDCGNAFNEEDVTELPDALVAAVAEHGRKGLIDARLQSTPGRRLLDLVRAELVQIWSTGGRSISAGEMLPILQAIESVRAAIEPGAAEGFVNQLAGLDGVELLVEVAHDFRSPLTSILFLAETLQRRLSGDINELQHRQLGLIYSAALGLSEVASNVLELIRGGNRLVEDEPSPFSVKEILESALHITHPMAEEKGLTLRVTPPSTDHRLGHPLALSRVLLNLTTNAVKFTNEGFVEIVARETGVDRIEFSVRDSGPGIDPNALDTLFSPIRAGKDRGRPAFSDAGLGLALCRRLVEAMGSELLVESQREAGTRFVFGLELRPILKEQAVSQP